MTMTKASSNNVDDHHVHFSDEDIARKQGKEHIDFPKTHACTQSQPHEDEHHVHFSDEDIARKEGKEHIDYPKTHKPEERSHVHFKEEDVQRKENKSNVGYPKTRLKPKKKLKAGKVRVSKEDFFQHLKILFGLALFLGGGTYYSSLGPQKEPGAKKAKSLGDMLNELYEQQIALSEPELPINNRIQLPRGGINSDGCFIFLTESSIPGSGFGVFTTKSFEEGELVIPTSKTMDIGGMELPLYAMLMKQHPAYGNVKSTKQGTLATKAIEAGEELFIDFRDFDPSFERIYHDTLHVDDPTNDDYEQADSIVREVIDVIPHKVVHEKKRKNYKNSGKEKGNGKLVPSVDAGSILGVIKGAMGNYNEKLAMLIPETTVGARSILHAEGTANFISNARSMQWIVQNGIPLDGLSPESSCEAKQVLNEGSEGAFSTRSVSAGDVIITAPLYAIEDGKVPRNGNCIGAPVEGVYLCPLSFAANIQGSGSCESGADDCARNMANAKYQWSEFNTANERHSDMTAEDFLKVCLLPISLCNASGYCYA